MSSGQLWSQEPPITASPGDTPTLFEQGLVPATPRDLEAIVGEWRVEQRIDRTMGGGIREYTVVFALADGRLGGAIRDGDVVKKLDDISYLGGTLRWTAPTVAPGSGRELTPQQKRNVGPTLYYDVTVRGGYFEGFMRAFFGAAEITGTRVGGAAPPVIPAVPSSAAIADGEVFTRLRSETFSIGGQTHTVEIYRSNLFAAALGLPAGETDPACELVLVPGGSFLMGSSAEVQEKMVEAMARRVMLEDESPQHEVHVRPFLIARTEVTQQLWRGLAHLAGLPAEPSFYRRGGGRAPVEQVSWHHVTAWLDGINAAYGLSLRLPTEAEWEYACRSGTTTPFYNGAFPGPDRMRSADLDELAWYIGNSGEYPGRTQPVGLLKPNAFGLYDMLGNVLEWCEDIAHSSYVGAPTDGSAWVGGEWAPGTLNNGPMTAEGPIITVRDGSDVPGRVRRGGSCRNLTYNTRAAMRSVRGPNFTDSNQGFRVAAPAPIGNRAEPGG